MVQAGGGRGGIGQIGAGGCGRRREDRGRDGSRPGGGDDGGFGLLEEPLDGLAVGFVAELPGELEDARGAEGGHADPTAAAVHLGVAVVLGAPLRRKVTPLFTFLCRDRQVGVSVGLGGHITALRTLPSS